MGRPTKQDFEKKATTERTRINIEITPENYDYVKTMARVTGVSQISFVNNVLAEHRADHGEDYREAKEFVQKLEKKAGPHGKD